MFRMSRSCIFFAVLVFSMQISAGLKDYKTVFEEKSFLTESIFQVLAIDLDDDRLPELMLAGKNYEGRELFVYWLTNLENFQPKITWQSRNLFEDRSILWIASGRFNQLGKVLLVMTNTKFYFFKYDNGSLCEFKEWVHNIQPLGITSGDVDGDGIDELIVIRVGDITSKMYNCYVQLWQLRDEDWKMVTTSALLGNIRGITAGDLNGDGRAEIIVEEGLRVDPGSIRLLSYSGDKLIEVTKISNAIKGAAYSLKVRRFENGVRLMTASTRGKINFFAWEGQKLVRDPMELSFGSELVDAEAADFNGDTLPELSVVGYPRRFMILKQ